MTRAFAPALVLGLAAVVGGTRAPAAPVILPGEGVPDAVTSLGSADTAEALGVSADGSTAAAVVPSERAAARSAVRLARSGAPLAEIELDGKAEGLVMTPAGEAAFLVVRIVDKKGALRRVSLVRLDGATGRVVEAASLPATSRGLALGAGDTTLLVAARNEIRSFALPDLSSGPLYSVPGDNSAVAALAGSTLALVAQGRRIALVNLAATQDRDGLKPVETVDAEATVRTLVAAPEEPAALALLDDGRVVAVGLDPLRLTDRGSARAIAWPGARAQAAPPGAPAEPVAAAAAPPAVVAPAAADAPPEPPDPPIAAATEPPLPPPPAEGGEPGSVRGTIGGPAHDAVRFVVVLGPDNILREAARAAPDASGRWAVSGLPAGAYRIVAAGDAGRVLICEPPYVMVRVGADGAVEAPAWSAMRVH